MNDLEILFEINSVFNSIDYDDLDLSVLREIGRLVGELSDVTRDTHGLINRTTGQKNEATAQNAMIDFDYYSSWNKHLTEYPDGFKWELMQLDDKMNMVLCYNLINTTQQNEDTTGKLRFIIEENMIFLHKNVESNLFDYFKESIQRLWNYIITHHDINEHRSALMLNYFRALDYEIQNYSVSSDLFFTFLNHFIYNLIQPLNLLPKQLLDVMEVQLKIEDFIHSQNYSVGVDEIIGSASLISNHSLKQKLDNLSKMKEMIRFDEDYIELIGKNTDFDYYFLDSLNKMAKKVFVDELKKLDNNIQCFARLFIVERIKMDDEYIELLINDYRLNVEKRQHQLESDLKLVREMIGVIDECLKGKVELMDACVQIGDRMQRITWNESDKDCIRNVHGVYNKHKKASNRENHEGARINFEVLANLRNLNVISDTVGGVIEEESSEMRKDLESLKQKLILVLSEGTNKAAGEMKLEFLESISCNLHDLITLSKMRSFIVEYKTSTESDQFNLDDTVCRYYIGYILVQVGELSKQISRQLRGEEMLNRLFKMLYEFRKEIKGHPNWISEKVESFLKLNEKFNLISDKVLCLLDELLDLFQNKLPKYSDRSSKWLQNVAIEIKEIGTSKSKSNQDKNENKVARSPIEILSKIVKTFCYCKPELLQTKFTLETLIEARNSCLQLIMTGKRQNLKEKDLDIEKLKGDYSMAAIEEYVDSNEITFQEFIDKHKKEKPIDPINEEEKESKFQKFMNKSVFAFRHLGVLEEIEVAEDNRFYPYASKMSLGIVGQCIKELFFDLKFKRYTMPLPKVDEAFHHVSKETVALRHSIMHAKNNETKNKRNKIEKWRESFILIVYYYFDDQSDVLDLNLSMMDILSIRYLKMTSLHQLRKYKAVKTLFEKHKSFQTLMNNDKLIGYHNYRKNISFVYLEALKNLNEQETSQQFLLDCYNYCKLFNISEELLNAIINLDSSRMKFFIENGINVPFWSKIVLSEKYFEENELKRFYELNEEIIAECEQNKNIFQLACSYKRKLFYYLKINSPNEIMETVRMMIRVSSENNLVDSSKLLTTVKESLKFDLMESKQNGLIELSKLYENAFEECCREFEKINSKSIITSETILESLMNLNTEAVHEINIKGKLTRHFLKEIRPKLDVYEIHFKYYPEKLSDEIQRHMALLYEHCLDYPKALLYYQQLAKNKPEEMQINSFYVEKSFFVNNNHGEIAMNVITLATVIYSEYFYPNDISEVAQVDELKYILNSFNTLQEYLEYKYKESKEGSFMLNSSFSGLKALLCYWIYEKCKINNESDDALKEAFYLASNAMKCFSRDKLSEVELKLRKALIKVINLFYMKTL